MKTKQIDSKYSFKRIRRNSVLNMYTKYKYLKINCNFSEYFVKNIFNLGIQKKKKKFGVISSNYLRKLNNI